MAIGGALQATEIETKISGRIKTLRWLFTFAFPFRFPQPLAMGSPGETDGLPGETSIGAAAADASTGQPGVSA